MVNGGAGPTLCSSPDGLSAVPPVMKAKHD